MKMRENAPLVNSYGKISGTYNIEFWLDKDDNTYEGSIKNMQNIFC